MTETQLSTWTQQRIDFYLASLRRAHLVNTLACIDSVPNMNFDSYQPAGMDLGKEKILTMTREHFVKLRRSRAVSNFMVLDHDLFVRTGQSVFKPLVRSAERKAS